MLNVQRSSRLANNGRLVPNQLLIRIRGTLPDIEALGDVEKSQRAAEEVRQYGLNANASCSFFALANNHQVRHIRVYAHVI